MEVLIFIYCFTSISFNDSLDWKGLESDAIQKRVSSQVKPGSIILFHNAAEHTPEALPNIIENLQKQGYQLVPVSQLVYQNNYTIDSQGCQHSNTSDSSSINSAP